MKNTLFRRFVAALAVAVTVAGGASAGTAQAAAPSQLTIPVAQWAQTTTDPFLCSDQAWTVQGSNGTITTWDLSQSPFVFNTITTLGFTGNSIAYNVNDGLLYVTRSNEKIYTIDAAGVVTDLGVPVEATTGAPLPSARDFNVGTFGPDGTYYIIDTANRNLFKVDVTTGTYTKVLMDSTLNSFDVAYDPNTGLLTTIENDTRILRTVDPNTGAVTRTALAGSVTNKNGAVIIDASGALYPYSNNGVLYKVEPPLQTGTITQIATGPSSTQNDGTSCTFGSKLFKTVDPATASIGDTVTYTFEIFWQGPTTTSATLTDTLGFGGIFDPATLTVDGAATTTPLGGSATISGSSLSLENMTLTTGSNHLITVDVTIPPGATTGDVTNQASLGGLGAVYETALSDNPDSGELTDPTPLNIQAVPLIGAVKSAGTPVSNGDGTFNVPFTITVQNTGGTVLDNLTLTDDLAGQLGAAFVSVIGDPVVTSTAAAPPVANTAYDPAATGSPIDATGAALQPGESYTVDLVVQIDPAQATGTLTNQATAGGTDPASGTSVTDDTDSGTDPTTGNTGEPGDTVDPVTGESGTDDPTPVVIPALGTSKDVVSVNPAASGTVGNVDVTYTMAVENVGTVDLTSVDLVDDIAGQFGSAFVAVTAAPTVTTNTASGTASANSSYDGTNSLATATTLAPGENFVVEVTIEVNPNGDPAALPLDNQATATGTFTDATGTPTPVTDNSDAGTDPGTDNGSGGVDDPTPLKVAQIGVAKSVGSPVLRPDSNFDIPYQFVVANTGSVSLNNLSLVDDLESQFGAGSIVNVAVAPTVSAISAPNFGYTATSADPELLDGSGTLAPGESFVVDVTVTVDASLATIPLENQATASGTDVDDPNSVATDLSDAGSDPEGINGAGGTDDKTVVATPAIGLAKTVTNVAPSTTNYGNQNVTYQLVLSNVGLESIQNISIADDLTTEFGSAFVGIVTAPSVVASDATGTVSGNANYMTGGDVELLDAAGAQLTPAGSITVEVVVEIDPDASGAPDPLVNQAEATVVGVTTGNTATDVSDSGTDPAGTNPGEPGDTGGPDDPTPLAAPALSSTKVVDNVAPSATTGHFDVTYVVSVQNIGNQQIDELSLTDDLNATFGAALVSVLSTSVDTSGVTATPAPDVNTTAYDGVTNTELLDGLGSLATGDRVDVTIVVEVDPSLGSGEFLNQATATGTDPAGQPVTDLTDSGTDPTTTNEGEPGSTTGGPDDPTPLTLAQIGVAKSATVIGDAATAGNVIVEFEFVVTNTGSETLTPIGLTDDFATQMGAAFVVVTTAPAISASTATVDPTVGSGNPDVLAGSDGELKPGESVTIVMQAEINPTADLTKVPLTNQAEATGDFVDASGATQSTTDLSDSGTDPATGNTGEPGDTVDPVTGESGVNDPTPVAVPRLGIAKAVAGTPVPAASGTPGNYDVTYEYVLGNTGSEVLTGIQISDDWSTELGAAFVGVVAAPQIGASDATSDPTLATGLPDFFIGNDGELAPGQTITVSITVEVDPDASGAILPLENQATATGTDQFGTVVTDDSDSGTDPATGNTGEPGDTIDPDTGGSSTTDPTPLRLPEIATAKDVGSPTPTENAGEFSIDYTLVVQNVGSEPLTNLSLVDDLSLQLGDAFGSVVSTSVTNIDADVAPGPNAAFDGSTDTELLDNTGTLQPGQSFSVTMTVLLTPFEGAATFPLTNQATSTGTWTDPDTGATSTVSDLSDAGGDPTTDNGSGGTSDPTAIINPAIRVAKSVLDTVDNGDGTVDVTYQYVVQNFGFVDLFNVTLEDAIVDQLGADVVTQVGTPTVTDQPASSFAPESGFDGTSANSGLILDNSTVAADDGLAPGETVTVTVGVTVVPTAATAPLFNQATTSGADADGTITTDLSDSGTDPGSSNTGEPNDSGGTDDPTPLQLPAIATTKAVSGVVATGTPGVFDVTYSIVVANTGSEPLSNLGLVEDLSATFGDALVDVQYVTVTNIDATTAPAANSAFDGTADTQLLDGTGTIAPTQSFSVELVVRVDADGDAAALPFDNSVTAAGDWTDADGNVQTVEDVSDSGTDPTTTNEGADGSTPGGTADPTPLALPALSVSKAAIAVVEHPGGPLGTYDVTYDFSVANVGTEPIANLTLTDDFATQFGAGYLATILGPTVTNGNVDPASDLPSAGAGVPDLLGGDGLIDPGENFSVTLVVQVDAAALQPDVTNTATVAGVDPDDPTATPIVDLSDSGTDPTSPNPTAPGNTTDPVTGEAGIDDPTPLILTGISVAKAATLLGPAASGTSGNFDVRFDYVVANTGNQDLTNLSLVDDLATQLGGAFVGIATPVTVDAVSGPNASYDGSADTELLDRSGTLTPGGTFVVSVVAELNPANAAGALENQATASGDWTDPLGNTGTADDLSDSGTNPTDGNPDAPGNTTDPTTGAPDTDDPTPIAIPAIAVAKAVAEVISPAASGTYGNIDLRYQLIVENTGTEPLTNVDLVDDIATQLGASFVAVTTQPVVTASDLAEDPIVASAYDGTASLATAAEMLPGNSFTIDVVIEVDPDVTPASEGLFNQATAIATGPDGNPVTDLSDSGTDPGSPNANEPNDSGGANDPTPFVFPAISLAKSAAVVGPASSGTLGNYDVTFTYQVNNTGNTVLLSPTLTDDLATQFGDVFVGVVDPGVAVDAVGTPNPLFDGSTDTSLLGETYLSGLNPGEAFNVTVTVELDPSAATAPLNNQAEVAATWIDGDNNSGTVTDLSDSGTDANSNNPDAPGASTDGADDPTPVEIPEIAVSKAATAVAPAASGTIGNVDVTYTLLVQNTGTVELTGVNLVDDIATQFGDAFVGVATAPAIGDSTATTAPTAVADYDGTAEVATGATLEPGQNFTATVVIEVDPDAATGVLTNQATATGDLPDGTEISDNSDSGTDPTTGNTGEPGDSVDPDSGKSGVDDPTPLVVPSLSLAKSSSLVGPAASGASGHYDIEFTVVTANTGNIDLTNLSVTDDLATQLGDAFIKVVTAPTVSDVSAPNASFDGSGDTELLDGSGTLTPGSSFEIVVVAEIDPSAVTPPIENQAAGEGDWTDPDGNTGSATDLSDSGTDPTNSNDTAAGATEGGTDDPTPISIGAIGVSKSAALVTDPASSGTFGNIDVTYEFVVANTGTIDVTDVSLTDDIKTQLGDAFVGVVSAPSVAGSNATTPPAAVADYDGSGDLATGGVLAAGQQFTVFVVIEVDPDAAGETLTNQATAAGTDATGAPVADDSDSGSNPATGNTGEPGDTVDPDTGVSGVDDPTPLIAPKIATTKSASVVGPATSGTSGNYDIELTFVVANTGSVPISKPSLTDDLASQFGDAFVGVVSPPAVSGVSGPNTGFDGSADIEMLDGSGELAPGGSFTVTLTVELSPSASAELNNQATASGETDDGTGTPVPVTDLSDSGTDPTSTNEDAPGSTTGNPDDPTPVSIPVLAVAKSVVSAVPAASGTVGNVDVVYSIVAKNTGNVVLDGVEVSDDIATQFGDAFVAVIGKPEVTTSDADTDPTPADYDGTSVIVNGGVLSPGQSFTINIAIEVDPDQASGELTNQATATGADPDGNPVYDDSDSGTDPAGGNTGAPGDSIDPDTGVSGVDDPTPLVLPAIGVAKTATVLGAASSGTDGNFDVEYAFVIANTGNIALTNLSLNDDLTTELGDVFVGVVAAPEVSAISGPNAAYDGSTVTELLDRSGTLAPGASFEVTVVVEIAPQATADDIVNQATGAGDWTDSDGKTGTVTDDSDSGTDPTTGNPDDVGNTTDPDGKPDIGDPTPLLIPAVAIAKQVTDVVAVDGGNAAVTFELKVANVGGVELVDLSVVDDLATEMGSAFVKIDSLTSGDFDVNAGFDGAADTEMLADGNTLAVGASGTITLTVIADADAAGAPTPLANQATATGTDADNPKAVATDESDSGADPNDPNDSEPGAVAGSREDPTLIEIASLSTDKELVSATDLGDGTQDLLYKVTVTNTGNVDLSDVVVYDDVDTQFATYGLVDGSEEAINGSGTANTTWDGSATSNVFADGQPLAVGESLDAQIAFTIAPTSAADVTNTLSAVATGPDGTLDPVEASTTDSVTTTFGSISGVVFVDADRDGSNNGEAGLEGVTISLLDADGNVVATTTTGPDGSYEFTDVPPGKYTIVETQPEGYGSSTPSSVPVTVESGGEPTVDFGDTGGEISGRLWIDADGDGIADPGEAPAPVGTVVNLVDQDGNVVATTTTDADGNYSFAGIPEGTYTVEVERPDGYGFSEKSDDPNGSDIDRISGASDPVTIQLDGCNDASQEGCGLTKANVDGGLEVENIDLDVKVKAPESVNAGEKAVFTFTPTNESNVPLPDGATYTVTIPACATLAGVTSEGYDVTIEGNLITLVWSKPLAPGEAPPPYSVEIISNTTDSACQLAATVQATGRPETLKNVKVPSIAYKKAGDGGGSSGNGSSGNGSSGNGSSGNGGSGTGTGGGGSTSSGTNSGSTITRSQTVPVVRAGGQFARPLGLATILALAGSALVLISRRRRDESLIKG